MLKKLRDFNTMNNDIFNTVSFPLKYFIIVRIDVIDIFIKFTLNILCYFKWCYFLF